jgi:hypothetical protein
MSSLGRVTVILGYKISMLHIVMITTVKSLTIQQAAVCSLVLNSVTSVLKFSAVEYSLLLLLAIFELII